MRKQNIKTENDLANFIIGQLNDDGWKCYEEVMLHRGGQIADIVAVKNNYVRVIETKMSASLALIEQAHHWTFYAHSVYVALYRWRGRENDKFVGYKNPKGFWAFQQSCRHLGLGVLAVQEDQNLFGENRFQINDTPGRFNRKIVKGLREVLCDEMLANGQAGTKGGGHWTPFKRTCGELLKIVRECPGVSMKEAISKIRHHYSKDATAIACLSRGVLDGIVPGVQIQKKDGKSKLYLAV